MGESGVPPDALDSCVDALAESRQLFHRGVGQRGGLSAAERWAATFRQTT